LLFHKLAPKNSKATTKEDNVQQNKKQGQSLSDASARGVIEHKSTPHGAETASQCKSFENTNTLPRLGVSGKWYHRGVPKNEEKESEQSTVNLALGARQLSKHTTGDDNDFS
jgi:hypothetical protein